MGTWNLSVRSLKIEIHSGQNVIGSFGGSRAWHQIHGFTLYRTMHDTFQCSCGLPKFPQPYVMPVLQFAVECFFLPVLILGHQANRYLAALSYARLAQLSSCTLPCWALRCTEQIL